ncbi:alpha-1,4-glucan--maltose-1-phosphate maltosyltransferase [Salegentibacter chungangensis]|uniref:Alpha-1,4-glucan:maltose-1-phosphate maltosyltransferase n=1 Tax=Salegentibacter chungangensis TaxID=1335724 RepID=A0ABW3NTL3_9FLAO
MEGLKRIVIEHVYPQIDCGKHPVKRIVNEPMKLSADIFGDGHDKLEAVLLYRKQKKKGGRDKKWNEIPMNFEENDHWTASLIPEETGYYEYTLEAWVDHYATWLSDLEKKMEAGQDIKLQLLIGAELMEKAKERATVGQKKKLEKWMTLLKDPKSEGRAIEQVFSKETAEMMYNTRDKKIATWYEKVLILKVERKRALFSAWYEFFPRSSSEHKGKHGTFKDSEKILPEIARMGFNVIYLPPIHPIGLSHRKGINNATEANPGDPGSPWAIGSKEGGHKAIHPELGSLEDFKSFVEKAHDLDMEIALDFAIQCSPDHPYVKAHPQWFKWRPDGTVQYAENPPKKYQDVLPVNFETEDWKNLWEELKSIVEYWIDKGIKIFRVDNPHTKSFVFWNWLIREINEKHDGIIFLAEAFTRPRVMEKLAKLGFTQSYTYFTWRNTKEDFIEYLTELSKSELREYFRPNFWPNTPDILPVSLEDQPESAFLIRIVLASTLSSNFGIYGPLFEFNLNEAYPGKEEYTRSEKYEIKNWDWHKSTKTKELITRLNLLRLENHALQTTWNIEFSETDNKMILCYSKIDEDSGNKLLIVVSLDPDHSQSGWVKMPVDLFKIKNPNSYNVHDLLNGSNYMWQNEWNYVELHPQSIPAHIFRIET